VPRRQKLAASSGLIVFGLAALLLFGFGHPIWAFLALGVEVVLAEVIRRDLNR